MKGLLLLLYETYVAGTRDSEKSFNPNIEVKVVVNGIPNKLYSQGMKTRFAGRSLQKIWKGKQFNDCNRLLYRRHFRSIDRSQEYE